MQGVRVKDLVPQGYLACDLLDFLELLGTAADCSEWLLSGVWAIGDRSGELERLANAGCRVGGSRLRELAAGVAQVIDGEFRAYEHGAERPWAVVRAVDSTYFEIFCQDAAALQRVRDRFGDVSACTNME